MHYNIQINIQKVEEPTTVMAAAKRRGYSDEEEPRTTRRTTELVAIKVTAEGEEEAYRKAAKMLGAATPDFDVFIPSEGE